MNGKTSVTLATCQILKKEKIIKGTLVIAPLRVAHSVWTAEVAKWSNFKGMTVSVCIGTPREREDALKAKADIYTINVENVEWLFKYLADKPWPFDSLVIDESTKFKNAQGVRFKALKKVIDTFKRVLILTGTPAGNGLEDLFGQLYLVDGGQRLGQFITHFRKSFFAPELIRIGGGQFVTKWHPRRDTAERIKDRIKDICLYMSDTDYLTMPELTFNTINVTLAPEVMKGYRKLESALHLAWGSAKINVTTASAAGIKLRQYVGGTVYGDDGVVTIHTEKLDALADLIEEAAGDPVLVAVGFKHEAAAIQAMLQRKFKIAAPYLGDGISPKASSEVAEDWNAGKLPVVLCHPASVGHGLNLQAGGNTVVWFTLTWSAEDYDQLNRRVYRQGQKRGVVLHHIIATGTKDEDVVAVLASKEATQADLLNALKRKK